MEVIVVVIVLGAIIAYLVGASTPRRRGKRHSNYRREPTVRSLGTGRNLPPVTRPNEGSRLVRARQEKARAAHRLPERPDHPPPPPIPASRKLVGRAWVIDGDTIAIDRIKIRLAGIDAPELDEPWGRKSKWAMVNICKGKTIHVDLTGETSYDRLVGTCYLPDGTDIGAELIKAGLALDGSYYSKGKYLHLEPEGVRQRLKFYGLKQRR